MKKSHTRMVILRAQKLREMGLSLLATANATGLDYETTLNACQGIHPAVNLPDLPGVSIPADIAPMKHHHACPDHVVAQIRQMRQDRYTRVHIARTLGVSVSAVVKYSPISPNTSPAGSDGRVKMTPEKHREICRLRYVEFMSFDKIADKVGVSALTVRRYVKIAPQ